MRKLLFLCISLLSFSVCNSQTISDYTRISLPEKFSAFKTSNKYNLNEILASKLQLKKYQLYNQSSTSDKSCDIAFVDIINKSSLLKTKIILEFKDCNGNVIVSIPAESSLKEINLGYQEALSKAVNKIPDSKGIQNFNSTPSSKITTISDQAPISKEIFVYNDKLYEKIQNTSGFKLTEMSTQNTFATFRKTSKKEIYLVILDTGTPTVGYLENSKIYIDIPNNNAQSIESIIFTSK